MDSLNSKQKDLIERYLLDRLSFEEEEQFTQHMEDPNFRKELEFKKDILEAIEYQGDMHLKSILQNEEKAIKKSQGKTTVKLFSFRRLAAIAASLLLLTFICWQIFAPKETNLFAEYFKPHPNTLFPGDRNLKTLNDKEQIFSLYEDGKYEKALPGFEKILSVEFNDDIAFYQANAFLAIGKTDEAITILQKIIQNGQTEYLASTKWNLALAYISQNKFIAAKPILEELKDDRFVKQKAEKLLKEPAFQKLN